MADKNHTTEQQQQAIIPPQIFELSTRRVQEFLMDIIARFGTFVVAGIPAIVVAREVYALSQTFEVNGITMAGWAFYMAFFTAVGFEVAGVISCKTTISQYILFRNEQGKAFELALALSFVAIYVVGVMGIAAGSDDTTILYYLGLFSPLLAISAYGSTALLMVADRVGDTVEATTSQQAALDEEQATHERAMQRQREQLALDREQAEWQAEQDLKAQQAAQKLALSRAKAEAKLGQKSRQNQSQTDRIPLEAINRTKKEEMSARRNEVLILLQQGKQPPEIANILEVHVRTIRRDIQALNGQVEVQL